MAICDECRGTGHCDACDGYGNHNETAPGAGDHTECDVCRGDGQCVECGGIGETTDRMSGHVSKAAGE